MNYQKPTINRVDFAMSSKYGSPLKTQKIRENIEGVSVKELTKKSKELKYDVMVSEILHIAKEIAYADGVFKNQEKQELHKLEKILRD